MDPVESLLPNDVEGQATKSAQSLHGSLVIIFGVVVIFLLPVSRSILATGSTVYMGRWDGL